MKEFCLSGVVLNENKIRKIIENCKKLRLTWEKTLKESKGDMNDPQFKQWKFFWSYVTSRISDVKQIFELILKHQKIDILILSPDFDDAYFTMIQALIFSAYNNNIYRVEVGVLHMWLLLCKHFCKQVNDDSDCDDSAFVIFPYYRADKGFDYDKQGLIADYKQLKKEGKIEY